MEDAGLEHVEGEDRYTVIGHTNSLRVLLVVWVATGDTLEEDNRRARALLPEPTDLAPPVMITSNLILARGGIANPSSTKAKSPLTDTSI